MPVGIQQRLYYMSRVKQSDYRTKTNFNTAAPYNVIEVQVEDTDLADYAPETRNNKGYSTRSYFATDVYLFRHGMNTRKRFDIASDQIGRWLYFTLGGVASAQPDAGGNPLVYRHTFALLNPDVTLQPPAFTWGEKVGGGLDHQFPSCCVRRLRLSAEDVGRLKGEVELVGSGKRINAPGLVLPPTANFNLPALPAQVFFTGAQSVLTVADADTLANPIAYCTNLQVNNWSIEFVRTLLEDDAYRICGGDFQTTGDADTGAVRSELLQSDFDITINMQVRVESGSAEYTALQTNKRLDWKQVITGKLISGAFNHKLTLNAVFAAYEAVQVANQNGLAVFNITVKPLFNASTGNIFSAILDNTTASYLV